MTKHDELITLAKAKLNITWDDEGTNARVDSILAEAAPAVANMVGLGYDYAVQDALDEEGNAFNFADPSLERNILLNYMAYEWNHQAGIFREAYWQEIAACRQRHELAADALAEEDGESDGETGSE